MRFIVVASHTRLVESALRMTSQQVMQVAENLYTKGWISYPLHCPIEHGAILLEILLYHIVPGGAAFAYGCQRMEGWVDGAIWASIWVSAADVTREEKEKGKVM